MSDQVEPRQLALEAIYEADLRAVADPARGLKGKARRFVEGVVANQSDIDGRLDEVSDNWPVHRMAAVDRAILRLGAYELAYEQDTPKAVVISEAIELAKRFSTQKSGPFINGVLAALAREMRD